MTSNAAASPLGGMPSSAAPRPVPRTRSYIRLAGGHLSGPSGAPCRPDSASCRAQYRGDLVWSSSNIGRCE